MIENYEVIQTPSQPALSIRTHTVYKGLPALIGASYMRIMQYMQELGTQPAGAPFVTYYNMDVQDWDVEIGFPLSAPLQGRDDIQAAVLQAGSAAACVYTGPYNEMAPTYEALYSWIQEKGYHPTGVVREVYLNDPADTQPQDLKTQILFLLE